MSSLAPGQANHHGVLKRQAGYAAACGGGALGCEPKRVAVVAGVSKAILVPQLKAAQVWADLVELRLDLSQGLTPVVWQQLLEAFKLPWILTVRSQAEGGHWAGDESDFFEYIFGFFCLDPAYIDLEYNQISINMQKELINKYKYTKFIASRHFTEAHLQDKLSLSEWQACCDTLAQRGFACTKWVFLIPWRIYSIWSGLRKHHRQYR